MLLKLLLTNLLNQLKGGQNQDAIGDLEVILRGMGLENARLRLTTKGQDQDCECIACRRDGPHYSDCAVHNAPAYPVGECDCGVKDYD